MGSRKAYRLTPARVLLGLIGLVIFGMLLFFSGPSLLDSLRSASKPWLLGAFVATVVLTALTTQRWALLTESFLDDEEGSGFSSYYRSFLLARVVSMVIPNSLADLAARPLLHRWFGGVSISAAVQGGILARIVDASLILPLAGLSLASLAANLSGPIFLTLLGLAMTVWMVAYLVFTGQVVSRLGSSLSWMARRLERWPKVAEWALSGGVTLDEASQDRGLVGRVGFLSAARYLLISVEFFCLAKALHLTGIGWGEILIGMPLAQVLTAVAVTPGGLGLQEGGFWGALRLFGVPAETAGTFLLGWRLLHTGFILFLAGAVTLLAAMRGDRR
jgi:uncharacterized membrane protein YbhN (UPF0104 family)